MIGFWDREPKVRPEYKTCVVHYGTILIPKKDEPGIWICPECGIPYLEKDTASEEQIHSMFDATSNQSRIIQGKKKRRFFDSRG